jgi:putative transposase
MAELKNEFSWSKTRDEVFKTCPRQYWFAYYGYWNGWLDKVQERTRQIYILKNLKNRQIVGWSMGETLNYGIFAEALEKALRRRKPEAGLIFHSDRGTQYASYAFRDLLDRYGFVQSMSSTGHCYDNALMESFFHTLKTELIYFEKYRTKQEARGSVFEYIEIFYNRTRRHSSLNYCSPAEFEKRASEA